MFLTETENRKNLLKISLIIAIGVLLRCSYLVAPYMDSDQATFGLQGIHALNGEIRAFSWGYAYIGTLQTFIDAVLFLFFGVSRLAMNAIELLFYILYGYSLYYLSRALVKDFYWQAAIVLLGAVAPEFFMFRGAWAQHGYPETYAFGTLMMAIACNELGKDTRTKIYFLISFIAGFAWWSNFLIIHYFLAIGLFFAYKIYQSESAGQRIKIFLCGLTGSVAGALPFWIYNLRNNFESMALFRKPMEENSVLLKFLSVLDQLFPVLMGLKEFFTPYYPPLLTNMFLTALLLSFFFFFLHGGYNFFKDLLLKKIKAEGLMWVLLTTTFLIFLTSSYVPDSITIRYLMPIYTVYPFVMVYALKALSDRFQNRFSVRAVCVILLTGILIINFRSLMMKSPLFQKSVRATYHGHIAQAKELFNFFNKQNKRHLLMFDYWQAPRYTFDLKERMIFEYIDSRYPPYLYDFFQGNDFNYLVDSRFIPFENGFRALGFDFRYSEAPGHIMYTDFRKNFPDSLDTIDPVSALTADGTDLTPLTDRRISTEVQINTNPFIKKNKALLFGFAEETELCGISVIADRNYPYVRQLLLKDSDSGKPLVDLKDFYVGKVYADKPFLNFNTGQFEVFFPPVKARRISINLTISRQEHDICVKEMFFFRKKPAEKAETLPPLRKILNIIPKQDYRIYSSPGAIKTMTDAWGTKLRLNKSLYIDFSQPTLFIFENEFLAHNMSMLQQLKIPFNHYQGKTFSAIQSTGTRDIKGFWKKKAILLLYDKDLSEKYLLKAEKELKKNKYDEALDHLEISRYYMDAPSDKNIAALKLLEKTYGLTKHAEDAKNIEPLIDAYTKRTIETPVLFDKRFRLNGLYLEKDTFSPGEGIKITYLFECLKRTKNDFSVFVHFMTPEGKILFQGDHFIGTDISQDNFFVKGEYIRDTKTVKIPAAPGYSGKVYVWLGLFDPSKNRRFTSETPLPDKANRVKIAEVNLSALSEK